MFYKFWMWLLGFKEDESNQQDNQSKPNATNTGEPSADDEGNFRSGPDGYQGGGGYEGR